MLRDKTYIAGHTIFELAGFAKGNANTMGSSVGDILIDDKILHHEFQIVPDGVIPEPYDVILGEDFLEKNNIIIDFGKRSVTVNDSKKYLEDEENENKVEFRAEVTSPVVKNDPNNKPIEKTDLNLKKNNNKSTKIKTKRQ